MVKTKSSSGGFSYFYVRNEVILGVTAKDDTAAAAANDNAPGRGMRPGALSPRATWIRGP